MKVHPWKWDGYESSRKFMDEGNFEGGEKVPAQNLHASTGTIAARQISLATNERLGRGTVTSYVRLLIHLHHGLISGIGKLDGLVWNTPRQHQRAGLLNAVVRVLYCSPIFRDRTRVVVLQEPAKPVGSRTSH